MDGVYNFSVFLREAWSTTVTRYVGFTFALESGTVATVVLESGTVATVVLSYAHVSTLDRYNERVGPVGGE